jgi:hypothetical protein
MRARERRQEREASADILRKTRSRFSLRDVCDTEQTRGFATRREAFHLMIFGSHSLLSHMSWSNSSNKEVKKKITESSG